MACEKYSGWMIDAALDALSPERATELLAHANDCRACGEAYRRARAAAVAVERGVASLVSSEPSPQFEARLRARLAAETSPSHAGRFAWVPIGAVAVALVAVLSLVVIGTTKSHSNAPVQLTQSLDTSREAVPDRAESLREHALRNVAGPDSHPIRIDGAPHLSRAKFADARARQPEVLVPPGQFAVVRHFAESVREGRIDGAQIVKAQQESESPLEIAPIQISPLDIPQLQDSGGSVGDS